MTARTKWSLMDTRQVFVKFSLDDTSHSPPSREHLPLNLNPYTGPSKGKAKSKGFFYDLYSAKNF